MLNASDMVNIYINKEKAIFESAMYCSSLASKQWTCICNKWTWTSKL